MKKERKGKKRKEREKEKRERERGARPVEGGWMSGVVVMGRKFG